jgi:hypothetical protein
MKMIYNELFMGFRILQQSLNKSRTASISSSSISSPSTLPRICVKLTHVNVETNPINRRGYNNQQEIIPIIFVLYQKTILIPDFNIVTMLKLINSNINVHTIEHYVRQFLLIYSSKKYFILRLSLLDINVFT